MSHLPDLTSGPMPSLNKQLHWVETLDGGAKVRLKVYSASIWEVWAHFNGRTKPCFKNHEFCEGGHDETTMRWYGFVFGWHYAMNKKAFVQLTAAACRQWFEQIASGISLRGMVIDVSRTASKKGRINLQVAQYLGNESNNLPPDCDPKESLFRLWKVKHVGGAYNLSLVSGPADLPDEPDRRQVS